MNNQNAKIIVNRQAIRELVREALDGGSERLRYSFPVEQSPSVVTTNAVVDPSAYESDPINPNFTPQDKVELDVAVRNLVKNLPDDRIPSIYLTLKSAIDKQQEDESKSSDKDSKMTKQDVVEQAIRKAIRQYIVEKTVNEVPKAEDDDSNDEDGWEFKKMALALGHGDRVHRARQEFDRTMNKTRFLAHMDPDDLELMTSLAVKDYIELLSSSGELSDEDIQLLKSNDQIVRDMPGFRNFLHKQIKRLSRGKLDDMRNAEIDGDEVRQVKPRAPSAPRSQPAGEEGSEGAAQPTARGPKATYRIYGRRGPAPVHTRFKGVAFAPTGDTKFKNGDSAAIELGTDGKLKVKDPNSDHTQFWESWKPIGRLTLKEIRETKSLQEIRHGKKIVVNDTQLTLSTKDPQWNMLVKSDGQPVARQAKQSSGRVFQQSWSNPDREGRESYQLEYYKNGEWRVWNSQSHKGELFNTNFLSQIVESTRVNQPVLREASSVPSSQIDALLADVANERSAMAMLSRMTPFSMWYKGEHGKTRMQLLRALKKLSAALKKSDQSKDQDLLVATMQYIDSVMSKSGSNSREFSEAVATWKSQASEIKEAESDLSSDVQDKASAPDFSSWLQQVVSIAAEENPTFKRVYGAELAKDFVKKNVKKMKALFAKGRTPSQVAHSIRLA